MAEERFVISRGSAAASISRRLPAGHTLSLRSNEVELQLEEVFRYFNISVDASKVLPRCVACNGAHHYDLSSSILQSIQDKVQERLDTRQTNMVVQLEEDSEEEEFGDIWDKEVLEVEEEEVVRRWETVRVLSSLTGEERNGQINLFTACTEAGTKLQVENIASEDSQTFWACANCGKVQPL